MTIQSQEQPASDPTAATGTTRFEPVAVPYEPVLWPDTVSRFGLITLDTDHATEREVLTMLPPDASELFVTRVRHGGQCDLHHLAAMGDELARAASLLLPGTGVDAIAYACTSGTVAIGIDKVRRAIQSAWPETPVTTPITAARSALDSLGVNRIAMLTPYIDEVNRMLVDHLTGTGITVTVLGSFGVNTDIEISSIPREALVEAAQQLDLDGAQALFISCTGLRTAAIIDSIEQRIGVPVVTSNQVMVWDLLRMSGYQDPVAGFGRLLDRPR